MSFSENLKQIRKEHHLSQDDLAELLDVSRQAVSKWEQGGGYPEVEKLLKLSQKLNVSLDALLDTGTARADASVTGEIVITSPNENVIVTCRKVAASGKMRGGKNAPQYALFGSNGKPSFWGETTTFLGWYADLEQISKEVEEIHAAIAAGVPAYTLQYNARTKRGIAGVKLVADETT